MTNSILCMLLQVLFHPSDSSRTWQNSSKLEPAYVYKNAQVSNGKPDLIYFVPEVFCVHDFGKKVDQKDVDVCCEMYNAQLHRRTWAIQRYRELLKMIDESMESSVSYYGVTSMYITLPKSASSRHILAITFMIQKL